MGYDAGIDRNERGRACVPYGIALLDDALCGVAPGDITTIAGPTGSGKTQVAVSIAFNAAKLGRRVAYFGLECAIGEVEDRLVWREICRAYRGARTIRYREWQLGRIETEVSALETSARETFASVFSRIEQVHRNEEFTIDHFISRVELARPKYELVILDHLNFLDFDDTNDNHALRAAIKKIRSIAFRERVPIIVLSQLRKFAQYREGCLPDIDDVYGASDVAKTATEVVITSRADSIMSGGYPTWFYLAKTRNAPDSYGYAGIHTYDVAVCGYSPSYQLYRVPRFSKPENVTSLPQWAKSAVKPKERESITRSWSWGKDD